MLSADLSAKLYQDTWLTLNPDQYAADSILVRFREDAACDSQACPSQLSQHLLTGAYPTSISKLIPGLMTVELEPGVTVANALAAYRASPDVLYAEPNYHIQVERIPDDIDYSDLWGLSNTGQTGGTHDADIDAPEAWDITTGSGNTIVAVIDTGVDYTHPDLQANMWVNAAELNGTPFVDDDGNGYLDDIHGFDFVNYDGDPMDDHNHGTHVAGTIGAVGNNSLGVTGVNWNVQIMAVKFLDAGGGGNLGDAISAIDYAIANGATISNNSWGFNGGFSPTLHDAIQNARDAGHIFAAAAGNGNFQGIGLDNDVTPFYPANFDLDNIVSVAAVDHHDSLARFSNYGLTTVDLAAPGVGILSTTRNGTYSTFNGTSMATPHVAGVIALVWDLHPDWSYQQVIDAVLESVDPISALAGRSVSGGRLNASQTVNFSGPEIRVLHNGLIVNDGIGTIDFGDVLSGVQNAEVFTIQNVGLEDLHIVSPVDVQAGFEISAQPALTTLSPGASTTFQIAIADVPLGDYIAQVSFSTNDSDESLFSFNVTSTVTNVLVLDDGDRNFNTTADWTHWPNEGFNNDMTFRAAGDGSAVATWDFNVTPGRYAVAATWPVHENRANDSPFTIYDGTSLLSTVRIDQERSPDDFMDRGVGWENLGIFSVAGNGLQIQLTNDANEFVIADGMRIERIGDLPAGPEIEVRFAGSLIADEAGSVDLGTGFFESSVIKEFSIRNVGQGELQLESDIELPFGFSLVGAPATTLSSGASTSFQVAMDTSALLAYAGQVSIISNDADESSYNFTIRGRVVTSRVLDNGDPGFVSNGDWTHWLLEGYAGDMHYRPAGTGSRTATWTFEVTPGEYSVAATWPPQANRATNAPFKVSDAANPLTTVVLNQEQAPNDFADEGANWESLGNFTITGDALRVELSDAANENVIADAIRIERLDLPPAPEVELVTDGTPIADGTGSFDYGVTVLAAPVLRLFSVSNAGNADLKLYEPISVPDGFSVTSTFGKLVLGPGESTNFEVQLDAAHEGLFTGELSFGTNDADEPTYNFQLSGFASHVLRIDNGDTGFAVTGAWTSWLSEGFEGDMHYSAAGSGSDRASWSFGVAPGEYLVAATWPSQANRATDAPFVVRDGTNLLANIVVNQEIAPNDFIADGAAWETFGTFLVTGRTLVIELTDKANENVIADAIRIERKGDLPAGPEIVVQIDGQSIEDGIGQIDFGSTSIGVPVSRTFTIQNLGAATLTIDSQLELPAGYQLSSPPATSLASGESTSFEVQLDGLTLGTSSGQLSMVTNDFDENPFNFALTGVVSNTKIIDNGDSGFSTIGAWSPWSGEGFEDDMHYSAKGSGADRAIWSFELAPGEYTVAATWPPKKNRATDAPFTILDGTSVLANVELNQELLPNDFTAESISWEMLGTFLVTSSTLVVELADEANEYVIADAIRLERVGELPAGPEIAIQSGATQVEDGISLVDFGTTSFGIPISRSFTVQNVGGSSLILDQIDLPTGFTLSVPPASTLLATGESTTFGIQFDGLTLGSTSGPFSMITNDADENPFDFFLAGTVSSAEIIDNGDAGFNTVGSWSPWQSEGFENDIHYSARGSGADTATWTFTVVPGRYAVAATWAPKSNRATNAPFTILDGENPIETILVNQELTPNDFTDQGSGWKQLGEFNIQGSSIKIVLSDAANDYVIADGVRIERIGSSVSGATDPENSIPPAAIDEVFRTESWSDHPWSSERRVQNLRSASRSSPEKRGRESKTATDLLVLRIYLVEKRHGSQRPDRPSVSLAILTPDPIFP